MSHVIAQRTCGGTTMKVEEFCKFGVTYDAVVSANGKISVKSGFRKIKSARVWSEREAHVGASAHRCEVCQYPDGWHYPTCREAAKGG